ncbi:MAG: DUF11 domain-containing protein, partial [Lentisphaeria bacterium]|nr:DUF11 domain-containing protein [Lentisphaeria bacterium]
MLAALLPVFGQTAWAAGVVLDNTAHVQYESDSGTVRTIPSNTVRIVVRDRTPSTLTFHLHAPGASGSVPQHVSTTHYLDGPNGTLHTSTVPVDSNGSIPVDQDVDLLPVQIIHAGTPVFLELEDLDQNTDPNTVETVLIRIEVEDSAETEIVQLTETGPNTGIFTGYVQTSTGNAIPYDGSLSVTVNSTIRASYNDPVDHTDLAKADLLVDPFGIVFDSRTGLPVNDAEVTLWDTTTNAPAIVKGDDGVSSFPSIVTSGGTIKDGSGRIYDFPDGGFRFPLIQPGNYQLKVIPPAGYTSPSDVSTAQLQTLPGAPFAIVPGSRLGPFVVNSAPFMRIDIPIDPSSIGSLFVRKEVGQDTIGIGEFVTYQVTLENATASDITTVTATDVLPRGFRYMSGSTYMDETKVADPDIAKDGRTLTFAIGTLAPSTSVSMHYVVQVTTHAKPGPATNTIVLAGDKGLRSNLAEATVRVIDDLNWKRILVGRVAVRPDPDDPEAPGNSGPAEGVKGVRIYLEDGTYVTTDEDGLYHIEGVSAGTHVAQMDLFTLPDRYEPVATENTRFANRPYSQFVDMKNAGLWRADFWVVEKEGMEPGVSMTLNGEKTEHGFTTSVNLSGRTVPVRNLRLMVMLPKPLQAKADGITVDGQPFEAKATGPVVTLRLGDASGETWQRNIVIPTPVDGEIAADAKIKVMLLFDAPDKKNNRLPKAELPILDPPEEGVTATMALQEPKKEESEAWNRPTGPAVFTAAWMEQLKPGTEWIDPAPGFNPSIPAIKVTVKHGVKQKVKLFVNDRELRGLSFEGTKRNKAKTLAVSRWRSVDIIDGTNHLVAVILDKNGDEANRLECTVHYAGAAVKAEFVPEKSILVADGKTVPQIAILLTDISGKPIRPGVLGEYKVRPPHQALEQISEADKALFSRNQNVSPRYQVNNEGIAIIKLEPTTQSGDAIVEIPLFERDDEEIHAWLKPAMRDWIMVGVAEGTAGYSTLNAHLEPFDDDDVRDEYTFDDKRVAFFAKGKIKGDFLLTIAYDSEKKKSQDGVTSLHGTIDPDEYYTLYGDETEQGYEAASQRKLYVKLERGQFYAMFGDYDTGLDVTELSRYGRSLNGFKSEYKGRIFSYNAFATETNQAFVRDEIRGDGTSGLYKLSRRNLVRNSEKIRIETRDRLHSERILSDEEMTRHVDYNIDYDDGTLWFKRPVMSKDGALNPIFIIIEYESEDGGDKSWTAGGRGSVTLFKDRVEVGVTQIHEGAVGSSSDLTGADATFKLTNTLELTLEAARTSIDLDRGDDSSGDAYLAEITQRSAWLDGRLYLREQDGDFGLGHQNGSEGGTRKFGADGTLRLAERLSLNADLYHIDNLETGGKRDVAETALEYGIGKLSLRGGYLMARDDVDGTVTQSNQVLAGLGYSLLDDKLQLQVDRYQSVGEKNDNSDYPTRTIFGANYALTDAVSLYGQYEITKGEEYSTRSIRGGIDTTLWQGATL